MGAIRHGRRLERVSDGRRRTGQETAHTRNQLAG